jgi:hypothetical protein
MQSKQFRGFWVVIHIEGQWVAINVLNPTNACLDGEGACHEKDVTFRIRDSGNPQKKSHGIGPRSQTDPLSSAQAV